MKLRPHPGSTVAALFVIFLTGCTGTSVKVFDHTLIDGRKQPRRPDVRPIVWGATGRIDTLDPTLPESANEVITLIHARLFKFSARGTVTNDLASATTANDDGSVSIRLREDATWHDGQRVTSRDVVATWRHVSATPPSSKRVMDLAGIKAIEPVGAYEVRVSLDRPGTEIEHKLAALCIVPAHVLEADSSALDMLGIGAGPFKLADRMGDTVTLVPHRDWHGGNVKPAGIIVRVIEDDRERARALAVGRIDAALIKPESLPLVGDGARFRIEEALESHVFAASRDLLGLQIGKIVHAHEATRHLWRASWKPVPHSRRR